MTDIATAPAQSAFETVYLVGGPRDNETLSVATDGQTASVTDPRTSPPAIHAVGSTAGQTLYEYSRATLPPGWPAVFAFSSDAANAWPIERVMAKLAYRGKAPRWQPRQGG